MAAEPTSGVHAHAPEPASSGPLDVAQRQERDQSTSVELEDDPLPDSPDTLSQNPHKRKGGRKPIYATVEERKQRNRQAQAAFRERRTEYIKQLENTLKQHEELLQGAQRDHQAIACQYASMQSKLNALERILRDHGVDIESELRVRGEHIVLPEEAPVPAAAFNNRSGSGVRRPLKHNGSSGNTKLDLLKAKAATARDSMISPISSPQSQASIWNEHSSPRSTVVTSPMTTQTEPSIEPLYPGPHSPLSANNEYAQQQPGIPVSQAGHTSMSHVFASQHASWRAGQAQTLPDGSVRTCASHDINAQFSGEWGRYPGIPSGSRAPRPPADSRVEYPTTAGNAQHRHVASTSSSFQQPNDCSRQSNYLTMPEGFSQEIFPLTYTSGAFPFAGQPASHQKRVSDS